VSESPLTVIMTETSFTEMKSESQVSPYAGQISSAINTLSNSYEDLSYIISNDTIGYKPIKINFTNCLNERIDFFEIIAQANHKTFTTEITNDLWIRINVE